jgi:hypothetical protein
MMGNAIKDFFFLFSFLLFFFSNTRARLRLDKMGEAMKDRVQACIAMASSSSQGELLNKLRPLCGSGHKIGPIEGLG